MVSEEAAQYACESQNLNIYWKNVDLLAQTPDAQPEREHPGEASPQNKTTLAGARRSRYHPPARRLHLRLVEHAAIKAELGD